MSVFDEIEAGIVERARRKADFDLRDIEDRVAREIGKGGVRFADKVRNEFIESRIAVARNNLRLAITRLAENVDPQ